MTTTVEKYIDLTTVGANTDDERALAGHLARYLADHIENEELRPTIIAILKLASKGILRTATSQLPIPVAMVNPYGPNVDAPIEGHFEPGDRAVLLHDIALSGRHLVDCLMTLRSHGLLADDMVNLTEHQGGALRRIAADNHIQVHSASLLLADRGRGYAALPVSMILAP